MTGVALLHGFGASGDTWDLVRDELPAIPTYAPSLRGFGGEDDVDQDWSIERAVDDASVKLTAAGLRAGQPFVLVGHSMGGKLALALALRQPPGLTGLVLLSPSPPWGEAIGDADRARKLGEHGDAARAAATVELSSRRLTPDRRRQAVRDLLRTRPEAWRWWLERGSRETLAVETRALPRLVCVLIGACDEAIPPHEAARFVRDHPQTTSTIIPGVGHLLPLEAASVVAEAVASLFREATSLQE